MRYLVLELLALSLLGFIWAKETTGRPGDAMTTNNSTNTTSNGGDNNGGNNNNGGGNNNGNGNNNNSGSNGGNNNSTNSNGTQTTKAPPAMTYMTTKNGQNHVFTSVRLLLGCFVLGALWL